MAERQWFTEITDHFGSKSITYSPNPHPSENAAMNYAKEIAARRKCLEVKVMSQHGGTIATFQSDEMEKTEKAA